MCLIISHRLKSLWFLKWYFSHIVLLYWWYRWCGHQYTERDHKANVLSCSSWKDLWEVEGQGCTNMWITIWQVSLITSLWTFSPGNCWTCHSHYSFKILLHALIQFANVKSRPLWNFWMKIWTGFRNITKFPKNFDQHAPYQRLWQNMIHFSAMCQQFSIWICQKFRYENICFYIFIYVCIRNFAFL